MSMRFGLWGFLLLAATAAGCGRGGSDGKMLARVGEREITVAEFEDGYRLIAARDTSIHAGLEGRRKVLESMIDKALLEQAAMEKYPSFNESQKERLRVFREDELRKALVSREVTSKVPDVREEEVRELHEARATRYRVRHIFLPARAQAEAAMNMIRQGAAFTSVAAAESRDRATATAGGEMDWFVPGRGPGTEFEQATMALAPGQMSGIVETAKGFEIIRLEEKAPAVEPRSYEAEKRELELTLKARAAERLTRALRQRLFEKYSVDIPPEAPGAAASWMAAGGQQGALPGVQYATGEDGQAQRVFGYSAQDSAQVFVRMEPLEIGGLLRQGALGDTAWIRARATGGMNLPEFARWLTDRPVDLWPDSSEPWTVERSLRDLAYDEVLVREAFAQKIHETPGIAARFADRENRSRVIRFHQFEIVRAVAPTPDEVERVYHEGRDRYRYPQRHVVHTMSTHDSSAAAGFAAALRSGETFRAASARFEADGVVFSGPDTLAAERSQEGQAALLSLTSPGQVSGPLRWSRGGYSVFQLVERLPAREMTFEEAKRFAEGDAVTLGQEALLKRMLADLRQKHRVTVNESLLETMGDPQPQQPARAAAEVAS